MIGVYLIKNKINNKIYIGKSKNIEIRWNQHKVNVDSQQQRYKNTHLYNAMRKYGTINFNFKILEYCKESDLNKLETKFIIEYRSFDSNFGYNKSFGGDGGDTFTFKSNELKNITRTKISKYMKSKPHGISKKSIKGKHITETCPDIKYKWNKNFKEAMINLSKRRKDGELTSPEQEHYNNLRVTRKGKGNPAYKGSYYIYKPNGDLLGIYDSIRIAVAETGFPYTTLNKCVLHNRSPKFGKWKGYRVERKYEVSF